MHVQAPEALPEIFLAFLQIDDSGQTPDQDNHNNSNGVRIIIEGGYHDPKSPFVYSIKPLMFACSYVFKFANCLTGIFLLSVEVNSSLYNLQSLMVANMAPLPYSWKTRAAKIKGFTVVPSNLHAVTFIKGKSRLNASPQKANLYNLKNTNSLTRKFNACPKGWYFPQIFSPQFQYLQMLHSWGWAFYSWGTGASANEALWQATHSRLLK